MIIATKMLKNPEFEFEGKNYKVYVFDGDVLSKEPETRGLVYEAYTKLDEDMTNDNLTNFQNSMKEYIDLLLGEGSFNIAFKDCDRNIFMINNLLELIFETLNKYEEGVINEFINE